MDIDPQTIFPRTKIGRDHQLRDAFRHGKVIERKLDEKTGRPLVRVQYLDKQGLISYWLPIKQFGSRLTSHFYCPKIGDNVNINHLANGVENAFVDGSFFTDNDPPPRELDIDTRHYETEDKTQIEYREKDSTFLLDTTEAGSKKGPSVRAAAGGVVEVKSGTVYEMSLDWIHDDAGTEHTEQAGEKITESAPFIEETADTQIKETAPTISMYGSSLVEAQAGTITLTASEITLTGHMTFMGDIAHTGNMITSGVHTDANGIHMGAKRESEDLLARIQKLEDRVTILEKSAKRKRVKATKAKKLKSK